jgi:hypothetical protein
VLQPSHSVLNIPRAPDGKMDCAIPINAEDTYRMLGLCCIRLLGSDSLKEDVCRVETPGKRRSEVTMPTVHFHLPEVVSYACSYWIKHIVSSGEQIKDDGVVLPFLQKHILHWMEASSWLGKTSDISHNIATLRSVVNVSNTPIHTYNATYLLGVYSSTKANSY